MEESITLTPSLDSVIRESEISGKHIAEVQGCEYRLGKGHILSKKRCPICVTLSGLIDLNVSWMQKIDTGRLRGRSIEISEVFGARSEKDAEAIWNLYRECDNSQRTAKKSLLRRYYLSFSCSRQYYTIRDVTIIPEAAPPIGTMIEQIFELFENQNSLPENFIHGNPTVSSISFLGKLPVPLKHVSRERPDYNSKYLIQVDFGGADSLALTSAAASLIAKQKKPGSIVVGDEPLGAIIVAKGLLIRPQASFPSFLREYPQHWRPIATYLLIKGLLSLYNAEDVKEYTAIITPSSKLSLKEAFEDLRGTSVPLNLAELLRSVPSHSPV